MRTFAAFAVVTIALVGLAVMLGEGESQAVPTAPTTPQPPNHPLPDINDDGPDRPEIPFAELETAEGTALDIEARLSHAMVPTTRFDEVYAQVEIQATEELPEARAPLNVSLVIDRSGSMRGDAMAQARDAARTFVDALDSQDRVALVSFDNRSIVEVESTRVDEMGRQRLHRAIDAINAGGTTNISGGLRDGYQQVQKNNDPEMLNRVVLMTDGIPNVGITTEDGLAAKTAEIRRNGVTVTALGFGTQYDADLMAAMATEGAGNFRHIGDAADLELAFADEISDLQKTVASGVTLELEPAEGVEIERVYGFSSDEIEGGHRLSIGELQSEARRSAVVKLSIDEGRADEERQLLDVRARYVDRLIGESVGHQLSTSADVVASAAEARRSLDSGVMSRVEELRTQESIREVIDLYASGDRQQAERRLEREQERIQRRRRHYAIPDDDKSAGRVDDAVQRIGSTVRNFDPFSEAARDSIAVEAEEAMISTQGRSK